MYVPNTKLSVRGSLIRICTDTREGGGEGAESSTTTTIQKSPKPKIPFMPFRAFVYGRGRRYHHLGRLHRGPNPNLVKRPVRRRSVGRHPQPSPPLSLPARQPSPTQLNQEQEQEQEAVSQSATADLGGEPASRLTRTQIYSARCRQIVVSSSLIPSGGSSSPSSSLSSLSSVSLSAGLPPPPPPIRSETPSRAFGGTCTVKFGGVW